VSLRPAREVRSNNHREVAHLKAAKRQRLTCTHLPSYHVSQKSHAIQNSPTLHQQQLHGQPAASGPPTFVQQMPGLLQSDDDWLETLHAEIRHTGITFSYWPLYGWQ